MKKHITVSNLTLNLWLNYVKPAAIAAGIMEEVPAHDEHVGDYTILRTDETAADEIAHCMYIACMNSHNYYGEYTSEAEARHMLYQLEVSIKYDLHNTAETVTALYNALFAMLNPETTETETTEETTNTTEEAKEEETMNTNELFACIELFTRIREEVEARTTRSAWSHGVEAYALDLVDELEEATEGGYFDLSDLEASKLVDRAMLNGAQDWNQYSWGGSSLCYDGQIAERLCNPSELKKTRNGERRPNSREEWLDVQARALFQASNRVKEAIRAALEA